MLATLRQRNFALLWTGGLVSSLGDWFLFIALPFYIYDLTGSALATGGMFIAESLPSILFGSLAGVFVDRWDRRRTMIVSDVARAVLLLLILAARSRDLVWVIYVVSFAQSTIGQFFGPAKGALIPGLVDEKDLVPANSSMSISNEFTRLVGPALGGAIMGLFGLTSVVVLDSASFAFSALMVLLIALPHAGSGDEIGRSVTLDSRWSRVWREFSDGVGLLRQSRLLTGLLLVMGTFMIGQGVINVLLIPFVKDLLHGDAMILGWIASSQGIGGLIGGLMIGQLGRSLPPARLVAIGLAGAGILIIAAVIARWLPAVLALIALIGFLVVAFAVGLQTLLQLGVADQYRGRTFGAFNTIQSVMMLVGMGLASAFGNLLGVATMLEVAGALSVLAGLIAVLRLTADVTGRDSVGPLEAEAL